MASSTLNIHSRHDDQPAPQSTESACANLTEFGSVLYEPYYSLLENYESNIANGFIPVSSEFDEIEIASLFTVLQQRCSSHEEDEPLPMHLPHPIDADANVLIMPVESPEVDLRHEISLEELDQLCSNAWEPLVPCTLCETNFKSRKAKLVRCHNMIESIQDINGQ
ncbi:hypothetical protein BKA67DRAFT_533741 [Truncatella angustata]|uniref:Uncharacterized protein n=1 Tax=Truncatella angustata TaxID=152316 RepID=A0A9P8UUU7_9PEZI|nr:uncharacterized protein BKA67DRAFT_533741 [Truncatella angustata]KAH6658606.1 hypothetical protein BKA67DRAFT_533741 [Truncatella angustata]